MMNVKDPTLVIVRGINSDNFRDNFENSYIRFGGTPQATPMNDANYVGLYIDAPVSAIIYIGIVESIYRTNNYAEFHIKAFIKLERPMGSGKAIRKHEYWHLQDFGINQSEIEGIADSLLRPIKF